MWLVFVFLIVFGDTATPIIVFLGETYGIIGSNEQVFP
jgi:hypothetical protein